MKRSSGRRRASGDRRVRWSTPRAAHPRCRRVVFADAHGRTFSTWRMIVRGTRSKTSESTRRSRPSRRGPRSAGSTWLPGNSGRRCGSAKRGAPARRASSGSVRVSLTPISCATAIALLPPRVRDREMDAGSSPVLKYGIMILRNRSPRVCRSSRASDPNRTSRAPRVTSSGCTLETILGTTMITSTITA